MFDVIQRTIYQFFLAALMPTMRKIKLTTLILDSVLTRAVNILAKCLDKSIKNYIFHGIDIRQALIEELSRYFKGKSNLELGIEFWKFVYDSTNQRIFWTGMKAAYDEVCKIIITKAKMFFKSVTKSNKFFMPYVLLCALDELRGTFLVGLFWILVPFNREVILYGIIGLTCMLGTEAYFFIFCSDDYFAMLYDASLQIRPRYPIEPDLFYDIDKLSQLKINLPETLNLNENLGNVDTSVTDQTKPKKFDYIYITVYGVAVCFVVVVMFIKAI